MVRWARRKNRPSGSILSRRCTCPVQGRQHCVVHRMQELLLGKQVGDRLFPWSQKTVQGKLRAYLQVLTVQDAHLFTFKAFRAGKATAMAASGSSLGLILAAGEWRSAAYLHYVNEEMAEKL